MEGDVFYLPPQEFWYLTVAKLDIKFSDGKSGVGTGFFILFKDEYFLVTARHVVDPKYLPRERKRDAVAKEVIFSFQCAVNPGTPNANVGYQRVRADDPEFAYAADDVDVACHRIPSDFLPIISGENVVRPCSFPFEFLATNEELSARYAGEPVVFVGFPDKSPVNKVGQSEFHYPLLRQGVFAYPPVHGLPVEDELGSNYGLLDSFAQAGFSGGPVISLQKGWADGSWHPAEEHRAPKVVGLICGHYRTREERADRIHAGLSFFARSSSICELVFRLRDASAL